MLRVACLALFVGCGFSSDTCFAQVVAKTLGGNGSNQESGSASASVSIEAKKLLQDRLDRIEGNVGRQPILAEDDAETRLLKKRANAARFQVENLARPYPGSTPAPRIGALQRLLMAEIELAGGPEHVPDMLEEVLEISKGIEKEVRSLYLEGRQPLNDLSEITFFRMDIELQLLKAREKK